MCFGIFPTLLSVGLDLSVLGQRVARDISDWDETRDIQFAISSEQMCHHTKAGKHDPEGGGF